MTPEDNKLLELAAKAIGANYDAATGCITFDGGLSYDEWNPLAYDSEALRLAIQLKFEIRTFAGPDWVTVADGKSSLGSLASEMHDGDPSKAVRKAITTAAAKIGAQMK